MTNPSIGYVNAGRFWLPGDQKAVAGSYAPSTHIIGVTVDCGKVIDSASCALAKVIAVTDYLQSQPHGSMLFTPRLYELKDNA